MLVHSSCAKNIRIIYSVYAEYIKVGFPRKEDIMILEYKVNETHVQAAWLKTLYDLIEELDCRCKPYVEESYNQTYSHFSRMRIIEVYGSGTMLSWLKLRMERYLHFISLHDDEIEAEMKDSVED